MGKRSASRRVTATGLRDPVRKAVDSRIHTSSTVNVYEPPAPELVRVKSRISTDAWVRRVKQAQRDEVVIRKILDAEASGQSLNKPMAKVQPAELGAAPHPGLPDAGIRGVDRFADSARG